jgi:MFS transporter, DHA3 family, macrolide efflux protein
VSDIGTFLQLVVVGSLIAGDTGSALQTGLVALATFVPQGLVAPLGGLLADRFDRRLVFATALLAQASATATLAVLLGAGIRTPGVLTLVILLGSAAAALGAPSYSAMLPDLVPADELMAMISLGIHSWNSGRIVGPLLATLLAATVGPAWAIGFNAVTFVGLSIAVWALRRPFLPHDTDGSIAERLIGGWRAVRATPGCVNGIALLIIFNLTAAPFMGLIPIYAAAEFGGGTGLTGAISSAQGAGAIIGGIAITMLAVRRPRNRLLMGSAGVIFAGLVAYATAPSAVVVVMCAALLGGGATSFFINVFTVVQRDAPAASRGRVVAMTQACMGFSYGLGLVFVGSIGDLVNLRIAFLTCAVLVPIGFLALTRRSPLWARAVDGAILDTPESLESLVGSPAISAA